MFDICIVGSGPSAVISAKCFIEKGCKVCLIDVGYQSDKTVPLKHFSEQLTPDSAFFYPSDDASLNAETGSAQITKAREHLVTNAHKYFKVESDTFSPFQTLASGYQRRSFV